jgi:hypothetical protein
VTGVVVPTVFAVTENVVDVAPCGTVTVEAMLTSAGDEFRVIVAPPVPAAEVRSTVQVDTIGGEINIGLQEKPFSPGGWTIITVPPLADAEIAAADGFAAVGLKICTVEEVFEVEGETFSETVATTPSETIPELSPHNMHVKLPVWFWQETDLLA